MKLPITMALAVIAVLTHGPAFGVAQDEDQQKCINALNKGMLKTAKVQLKANAKCVAEFARGENASASACYAAPAAVAESEQKTCDLEPTMCTTVPTLGPTGCGDINAYSDYEARRFADDLLGDVPDSGVKICETDPAGCRCQGKLLKTSAKLYSTIQKQFNRCKKQRLRNVPIVEPDELVVCLATDFQDEIANASVNLLEAINTSCSGTPVPFAAGECAGLGGTDLHVCLEQRVRCHVCINAEGSDNFGQPSDCDNYDDGEVGSCTADF